MFKEKSHDKTGEKVGYTFSFFIFSLMLFLFLSLFKKVPEAWSYAHIAGIALAITFVGFYTRRFLR